MKRLIVKFIATFFFIGEVVPVAPGTAASAAALLLYLALPSRQGVFPAAVFGVLFVLGVWAAGAAEKIFGRKDPREVVIDEAACLYLVFWGLPGDPVTLAAGFVLYRLMDVVKPFPARRLERLAAGWGIMLDDLVAGLYAHALLRLGLALKFALVPPQAF